MSLAATVSATQDHGGPGPASEDTMSLATTVMATQDRGDGSAAASGDSTTFAATVIATPFGPLSVVADGDVLVAAGFGDDVDALRRHLVRPEAAVRRRGDLGAISTVIGAYLEGDVSAIDGIQVRARGSDTMQVLWARLRAVSPGTTVSYAALGGDARRARVAAAACARNPICVVVPCHRVIRSDGGLGGFGGGLAAKRWLLGHEARYRTDRADFAMT